MNVEVRRSARRRKTVEARLVDGILRVAIPAAMTRAEEAHWVRVMEERFNRRAATDDVDLVARAERLAVRYHLARPSTADASVSRIAW